MPSRMSSSTGGRGTSSGGWSNKLLLTLTEAAFREILGPDLVIINLRMSAEDRRKRVLQRHKGSESAADMMQVGERTDERLSGSL